MWVPTLSAREKPSDLSPYVTLRPGLYAIPSLHGRPRFAALTREAVLTLRPDAIAVELPGTLEASIRQGVQRLPFMSVVGYSDYDEALEKVTQILPITPDDSLIEAVRLALEGGISLHFIDRDVLNYQNTLVSAPDDYLLERLGLNAYWQHVQAGLDLPEAGSDDALREQDSRRRGVHEAGGVVEQHPLPWSLRGLDQLDAQAVARPAPSRSLESIVSFHRPGSS